MAVCSAGFETGVNGNAIQVADAGDATAWDTISLGAGATALYDNTHVHRGSLAAKLNGGAGNTTVFLAWVAALGTITDHYDRAYLYFTANPDAAINIINFRSGGASACSIRINTAGTISLLDAGGAVRATSATAIALNQEIRIEWHIVHDAVTGSFELRLFNTPDSDTPTETFSFTNQNTAASSDSVRFQNTRAAVTYWIDDIYVGAAAYPGASIRSVTGVQATATAAGQAPTPKIAVTAVAATATAAGQAPTPKIAVDGAQATATAAGNTGIRRPQPTVVALAVHEVKISWNRSDTGWFNLDDSLLDGSDALAPASIVNPAFTGEYDDVSGYLREANWSRGRTATLEQVEQGKWSGSFRDPDGRFNPNNPASPLYGLTSQPGRPIRHRAKFNNVWYDQFYGYIRSLEYEPRTRGRGILHVEADDIFVKLDQPSPTIPSQTGTTTGEVIAACLDAIGYTDPAYRNLGVGDLIGFWPGIDDESSTLLSLIAEVLQVEFGLFYANAAGITTYETRQARSNRPVAYVISESMRAIAPGTSLDRIKNKATFTKTGSTPQTATDTGSADPVFGFGPRPFPTIESPYIQDDDAALARAQYVVGLRKDPVGDLFALTIDNRTAELLQAVLDLEFSDRVQADEASTGSDFDGFIERVERSVTSRPYRDTANYVLSERGRQAFILDDSLLDGADVLTL